MPLVITVALLKGGVSKTTTAVALAEAAAVSVPVTLLDTDPMGSAVRWAALAAGSGQELRSTVKPMATADLGRHFREATRGATAVIIDTPPRGAADTRAAVVLADRVVMPVPPNLADLDRVHASYSLAAEYGKPAAAVLTQVRGGIEDAALAAVTLRSWGVPVYGSQLPLTVAVQRAYGLPLTSGPLLRFGFALMTEILTEVDDAQTGT